MNELEKAEAVEEALAGDEWRRCRYCRRLTKWFVTVGGYNYHCYCSNTFECDQFTSHVTPPKT